MVASEIPANIGLKNVYKFAALILAAVLSTNSGQQEPAKQDAATQTDDPRTKDTKDTKDNAHACKTTNAPIIVDSDVPNTSLPDGAGMTAAVLVNPAIDVPQVGLETTLQPEGATVAEGLGTWYE